jgi:uncharacterized damage-inducible protein DinB
MLDYIHMIYGYNYWGNARILDACASLTQAELDAPTKNGYASLRATLVHAMHANWIWLSRWQGVSPTTVLDERDYPTLASIRERWQREEQQTRAFLASLTEEKLASDLTYQNLKGVSFTLPLWQTMVHLVNHGTQHRSEVAFMLTALDRSPGDLDMSLYLNSRRDATR